MSTLTDVEKRYLENILDMGNGYVLDYTDATYGEFFDRHGVDIHGHKYQTYGTSKAKRMRPCRTAKSRRDRISGGKRSGATR